MARYRIYVLIIALYVFPSLCYAQGGKDPIVGTWKLVCIERVRPNGKVQGPDSLMEKNPTGLLIYDTNGYFLTYLMAQEENVIEKHRARFGTYEVREKEGIILERDQGSLKPGGVGKEWWLPFEIRGDRLMKTWLGGRRISYERVEKGN